MKYLYLIGATEIKNGAIASDVPVRILAAEIENNTLVGTSVVEGTYEQCVQKVHAGEETKSARVALVNFKVANDRFGKKMIEPCGMGKFDRLDNCVAVALAQVKVHGNDNIIGFIVADKEGNTKQFKTYVVLKMCRQFLASHKGGTPIQNMVYVEGTETKADMLREFPGKVLPTVLIGNKYTAPTSGQEYSEKESKKNEVSSYRIKVLEGLARKGIDRKALYGLANPRLSDSSFDMIARVADAGIMFSDLCNTEYTKAQLVQLVVARFAGIDISTFADSKLSANEMSERRIRIALGVWESDFSSMLRQ